MHKAYCKGHQLCHTTSSEAGPQLVALLLQHFHSGVLSGSMAAFLLRMNFSELSRVPDQHHAACRTSKELRCRLGPCVAFLGSDERHGFGELCASARVDILSCTGCVGGLSRCSFESRVWVVTQRQFPCLSHRFPACRRIPGLRAQCTFIHGSCIQVVA